MWLHSALDALLVPLVSGSCHSCQGPLTGSCFPACSPQRGWVCRMMWQVFMRTRKVDWEMGTAGAVLGQGQAGDQESSSPRGCCT